MPRIAPLALLLACLAALSCGPDDGTPDSPLEDVRDTLGEDTTLSEAAVRGPPPVVGEEPGGESGDAGDGESAAPESGEDSGERDGVVRERGSGADGGSGDALPAWTVGRVAWSPESPSGSPVIAELRQARNDGFDRLVVELRGGAVPAYEVEYVDRPLHECGSGNQIHPVGDGWLQLRLQHAMGHTEAGDATIPRDVETPALQRGLRIYRTCDFEGMVTLVLAVDSPEPFRAFHLREPARVVVDVRH